MYGCRKFGHSEAWTRLEEVTHSVFVDNLPESMSRGWLWQLFSGDGEVVDVFISRKERRLSKAPFGFVRFTRRGQALEAVKRMHGMEIRGAIYKCRWLNIRGGNEICKESY